MQGHILDCSFHILFRWQGHTEQLMFRLVKATLNQWVVFYTRI